MNYEFLCRGDLIGSGYIAVNVFMNAHTLHDIRTDFYTYFD